MTTLAATRHASAALPRSYVALVALVVGTYGLQILLLVEWVRGLVGLDAISLVILSAFNLLTMIYGYRHLRRMEASLPSLIDLRTAANWVAVGLTILPLAALLLYRGVGGARAAATGALRVRETWALADAPALLKPLAVAGNYLMDTWLATLVAILVGAAVLGFWPALLRARLSQSGWSSHLLATVLALPNMFCSCCASPIAASLYRGGAATGPTLAFAVAAPSLNLITLLLAFLLLPPELAVLRVAAGVLLALPGTYLAAFAAARWGQGSRRLPAWPVPAWLAYLGRLVESAIARGCQLEIMGGQQAPGSPSAAMTHGLLLGWRIARLAVPVLVFGYLAAGLLTVLMPVGAGAEPSWTVVAMAALVGTLLMIPTAVEIPTALVLAQAGLPALAAVCLVTLAPVSLPSLLVIGSGLGSFRAVVVLGGIVYACGLSVGLMALAL